MIPANIFSKLEDFSFEVAQAGFCDAVNARRTAFRGGPFFRFKQSLTEHALKSGVEGAFFDLEEVIGDLLDVFDQGVAMHRFKPERLEDHDFECAGEEVAVIGVFRHGRNSSARIPIL